MTWTCSSWAPVLGHHRAAGPRPRGPWGRSTWRSLPPGVGAGVAHRPTPALPTLGCPGIPRAALGQRPGSVGYAQGPESRPAQGHGGLDPISLCVGPAGGLKSPQHPQSPGPGQPRSLWVRGWCPVQGVLPSRIDSGRRQGTVHPLLHPPAPTLCGAPCLPSSLQPLATQWDTRVSDGSRVSIEPQGG